MGVAQPSLVDHQKLRADVVAQPAAQRGIAVACAQIAEQLACAGQQNGMPGDQCLVGDILRQRRFLAPFRFSRLLVDHTA